ncbi:M14 family metallopeptidase [soil metagenome]
MKPGIHRHELTFPYKALAGWRWPAVDIAGALPGPRLAIIAGVHPNETSAIDAVIRLQQTLDAGTLRGRVSIIPVVNLPGVAPRSQYVCPLDGKNINFSFPGSPDGTFSEAIAYALLSDWAADADCFVDLHGGDLCEQVSHFMVCQTVGEDAFDQRNFEIAKCFDAEIIVRLDPSFLNEPARSCTGRAKRRQHAAFAEAGRWGLAEEAQTLFHYEGLLRLAKHLGMIDEAPPLRRKPAIVTRYHWLPAPADAFYRYSVEPGQRVAKDTLLATGENTYGDIVGELRAPYDGHILWRITHAFAQKDGFIVGLGTE